MEESYVSNLIRLLAKFWLDETQKMFLIHAWGMVHMGVNFSYIVEVPMWSTLLCQKLPVGIQHKVNAKFLS
jgi:hypothetical protein